PKTPAQPPAPQAEGQRQPQHQRSEDNGEGDQRRVLANTKLLKAHRNRKHNNDGAYGRSNQPRRRQVCVDGCQQRSARKEAGAEQPEEEYKQSREQPRQKSKEAGNVLLQPDDPEHADADQNEPNPRYPKNEPAKQLGGRGQCGPF